jgi:hypothetical protein
MTPARAIVLIDGLLKGTEPTSVEMLDAIDMMCEGFAAWVEAGGEISLDKAMGLRTRGGVSPARALALEERNALLRDLWLSTPAWAALPPIAAAGVMSLSVRRYEADRWPRERNNDDAPSAEPAATWWRCLRLGAGIPDAKRLGQILSV